MTEPQPSVSVVTTETIPGCRIVRMLGYVEGGGLSAAGTSQAILAMVQQAQQLGANAVVGMRWSHGAIGEFSNGMGSIGPFGLVYGTAVIIEPDAG